MSMCLDADKVVKSVSVWDTLWSQLGLAVLGTYQHLVNASQARCSPGCLPQVLCTEVAAHHKCIY